MAKAARVQFICQNCGAVHARWAGKCDSCGEWNTLVEEGTNSGIGSGPGAMVSRRKGRAVALTSLSGDIEDAPLLHPCIGRQRHVHQHRNRQIARRGPHIGKDAFAAGLSGFSIRDGADQHRQVQFLAVRLGMQRLASRPQGFKLAANVANIPLSHHIRRPVLPLFRRLPGNHPAVVGTVSLPLPVPFGIRMVGDESC